MTSPLRKPGQSAIKRDRSDRPVHQSRPGAGALLAAFVAMAFLGSVLFVAATDSGAQAQDTPTEDAPTEDGPTEDAPTDEAPPEDTPTEDVPPQDTPTEDASTGETPPEDTPTEDASTGETPPEDTPTEETSSDDAPTEDAPTEEAPPEDMPTEETSTDDTPAPDESHSVTSGHYGCPERPPSRYHADVPSWDDWCLDAEYWIVEVTCSPTHANAGQTVRFDTEPPVIPQLVMYDLCGYADLISECPPTEPAAGLSDTSARGGDEITDPAVELDETSGAAFELGDTAEAALGPDEISELTLDLDEITDVASDLDEIPDLALGPDETTDAPADLGEMTDAVVAPDEPCGPPWPPGTWYQYSRQDPITGAVTAGGRAAGAWLGVRHHAAVETPSLLVHCAAGKLSVVVHTGGVVVATYGRGIPVDYRIGETIRFEEWNEVETGHSRRAGVSLPPWFTSTFMELLRDNPEGDFLIRVFGHDGAEVGTAQFDLAAIEKMVVPILEICAT